MAKTKTQISFAVTAKLISAFVFATRIVELLFYLNPKFHASSAFLCLYRSVCVGPVRKPHCWFSHEVAHIIRSFGSIEPVQIMPHHEIIYVYKHKAKGQFYCADRTIQDVFPVKHVNEISERLINSLPGLLRRP